MKRSFNSFLSVGAVAKSGMRSLGLLRYDFIRLYLAFKEGFSPPTEISGTRLHCRMEFGTRLPLAASKAPAVLYGAAPNLLMKLKVSVSTKAGESLPMANFPHQNQVKQTHQRLSTVGLGAGKEQRQRSVRDNKATIGKAEK